MQLLVIRHGAAEDAAADGENASRALTKSGKRDMKQVAAGLKTLVETMDVIAASPLVRAQQTAEIVAAAYDDLPVETLDALSPGSDPAALTEWLQQHESADAVAVVGHEPHLGNLVTWFLTGSRKSAIEFSKGGVALVEFSSRIAESSGILRLLLTRSALRRLGD